MKIILCLSLLSTVALAKNASFSGFSEALNQNIDKVIENNPQAYETKEIKKEIKQIKRGPASVSTDPVDKTESINGFDKLEVGSSH
jgi:hypothetical protein